MNHNDHVRLIQSGIPEPGGVWADFGSGQGAFTLALAECIGESGEIYSIDRNKNALTSQKQAMDVRFPDVKVHYILADFSRSLQLPFLDGVIMANSLHFFNRKDTLLKRIRSYLKPGGRLIIVEYNVDRGNYWVPHPFSYPIWEMLADQAGFTHTRQLTTQSSHFLGEMYSAVSWTGSEI